jgi:hypothetical protein
MRDYILRILCAVTAAASVLPSLAAAQDASRCYSFSRDREGNIREGLCVGSREKLVFGPRDQISRACEALIVCGGKGDLGDCHLARNVCKGFAAAACDASGFDVFNGPAIQNATCQARLNDCLGSPGADRALCSEIRSNITALFAPPTALAAPVGGGVATAVPAVPAGPRVKFRLPVEDPALIDIGDSAIHNWHKGPVLMDHDPATRNGAWSASCRDYRGRGGLIGLPHCYGGHTGSDFVLRDGFARMASPGNFVVAAADGEVIEVKDHLYDRCHGELISHDGRVGVITCDGEMEPGPDGTFEANVIRIRHADQFVTSYFHIKRRSALVQVGQRVTCGTRIASIGSSGSSYVPHVHFEVRRNGQLLDPFAGPLSQSESFWVAQGTEDIPAARCQ